MVRILLAEDEHVIPAIAHGDLPDRLTADERTHLEAPLAGTRHRTGRSCDSIVLYAADGLRNDEIAARLDTPRASTRRAPRHAARLDTPRQAVGKWRKRFYEQRLAGLGDLPRGRAAAPGPPQRCEGNRTPGLPCLSASSGPTSLA
jgi:hypothetical protein